ncbi:hypothetical protein F5880DRAFT_314890 [Lentinula raphanica]|nr:hypothetical protein F5880DRAFT_314890 [Lentinula raphanica]
MFQQTLTHFLSRPIWLLLAMSYLPIAFVDALPLPARSDVPGALTGAKIPITLAYYSSFHSNTLKERQVKEYRKVTLQAEMEESGEIPKEEGKTIGSEEVQKAKTIYAGVTPGLCIGSEKCWFYQTDPERAKRIKTDILPQTRTSRKSQLNTDSSEVDTDYHKPLLVSISDVTKFLNFDKDALSKIFSTFADLESALTQRNIKVDIYDGRSLISAMLLLMKSMGILEGYDEYQTLEQNTKSDGTPSWGTLRFGQRGFRKGKLKNLPEIWTLYESDKDDLDSLCLELWNTCLVFEGTEVFEKECDSRVHHRRPDEKEFRTDKHPRLNIRLDDLYIDLKRTHDPRASEYFNQIKEDLKNVKRLSQLTGVKIEDKSSYMRACFWRLKQVKMLRLTDQELKQNLDKPHRDLIYRDLSRNPRGAKKPALPLEEGGSSSDYSDKRQKLDTSTTSISSPGPSNQDSLDADHSNKGPIEPHPMSFAPVLPPKPVSKNLVGAKRPAPPLEEGGSSSDQSDKSQKLDPGTTSISSAGPSNHGSHGADHSNEGPKEPHPMSFAPILRPEPVSNTKSVSAVADISGSQRPDPMSFKNILHKEQVSNTKSTSLAGTSGDQRRHPMSLQNILNEVCLVLPSPRLRTSC